jgi:hypothetical protein
VPDQQTLKELGILQDGVQGRSGNLAGLKFPHGQWLIINNGKARNSPLGARCAVHYLSLEIQASEERRLCIACCMAYEYWEGVEKIKCNSQYVV